MQITQKNLFSFMQDWLRECDIKILGYHNDTKAQKAKKFFCESLLQISYKAMKNPLWHNIKK